MIVSRDQLENTKMPDLKQLIVQLGGDSSAPNETKANLIDRILFETAKQPEKPLDEQIRDSVNKQQAKKEKEEEPTSCTMAQVIKAVNPYILRGMKVFYDKDSHSWLFRVKIKSGQVRDTNTGETQVINRWRDDSGTLNQPLKTIVRCASILMQNASQSKVLKAAEYDPTQHYEEVV